MYQSADPEPLLAPYSEKGAGRGRVEATALAPVRGKEFATVPSEDRLRERGSAPGSNRLRILHVVHYLGRGGAELVALELSRHLETDGFESRFCALRGYDQDVVSSRLQEGKLFVVEGRRRFPRFDLYSLMRIMRAWRPHIVHSRNWGTIEAVVAARLAGVPVVIHSEHGYELDMLAGLPLRRKYARRIAYAMADLVFAVTHNLRDFHARQVGLPPERFRVIYNGVDTQRFAPRPKERAFLRHKLGLSEGCFVVGTVGRMVPIKDHGTLIKAAGMLSRRGLNTHLLLVGSGPEIEQHRQTVQGTPELTGRVSFLGASDNIPEPLNAMDAFVLPSIAEGMSNTLLEAMATGLPIVATRVGGNPELVEEGTSGQLFSPGDVADLADRLGALARSSETRLRLGAAARRRVLAHFTLEQMVANYRKMYRELADQRRIPRGSEV